MTTATEKACTKCGEFKPLADYHRHSKSRDGHRADCKVCAAAYWQTYDKRIAAERVEPAPTDTKTCIRCDQVKPLTDYHRDSSKKDGHRADCKVCVLAKQKAYREANAEQIATQEKAWRVANRERYLARKKAYHAEKWAKDPEYRARYKAATTRRRRMLASAKQEPYTRQEILARDGWVCGICDEPIDPTIRYEDDPGACATLDHIVPLSRGGDDTPANVQAAHGSCNYSKRDRVAHEDEDLEVAA